MTMSPLYSMYYELNKIINATLLPCAHNEPD